LTDERREKVLQLDRLQVEIGRLVELAASGQSVAQAVAKGLQDRQERAKALEVELAGIDGRLAAGAMTQAQVALLLAQLRHGLADLPSRPAEDQALTLRTFVKSVILRPDPADKEKGEIDLSVDLPFSGGPEFVPGSHMVDQAGTRTNLCLRQRVRLRPVRRPGASARTLRRRRRRQIMPSM